MHCHRACTPLPASAAAHRCLPTCRHCSGGKLLRRLSNFQKTVTSVSLAPAAGPVSCAAAPRLLAGSLDGHVKVFELDAWRVTAASRYPAPVTGVSISADAGALAVGMADGTLCVRRHARPRAAQVRESPIMRCCCWCHVCAQSTMPGLSCPALPTGDFPAEVEGGRHPGCVNNIQVPLCCLTPPTCVQAAGIGGGGSGRSTRRTPRLTAANFRFFLRGRNAKAGAADTVIAARRRVHLAPYDRSLRAFRYRCGVSDAGWAKPPPPHLFPLNAACVPAIMQRTWHH